MQKSLLIMTVAVTLSGCINLSFDSLEYDRYILLKEKTDIMQTQCESPDIKQQISDLKYQVDHQVRYSSYRKATREHISESALSLKQMVDKFDMMYKSDTKPSTEYCKQKLENISTGLQLILQEVGKL